MQVPAGRRLAADVVFGILMPLGLARIEPLVERVPSLGLWRGPAALVLVAVAAGLVVARVLTEPAAGMGDRLGAGAGLAAARRGRRPLRRRGAGATPPGCRSQATSRTTS